MGYTIATIGIVIALLVLIVVLQARQLRAESESRERFRQLYFQTYNEGVQDFMRLVSAESRNRFLVEAQEKQLGLLRQMLVLAKDNGKLTNDSMLADSIRQVIAEAEQDRKIAKFVSNMSK